MTLLNLTKMAESWLVTSNFSFSHSVFKRLVSQGRQKVSLCGNGLSKERNDRLVRIEIFADKNLTVAITMISFGDRLENRIVW